MVYIDTEAVTPEGMLSLTFCHASEYVIVFDDKQMSQSDVPSDLQPLSMDKTGTAAKMGDEAPIGALVVVMIAALAAVSVVIVKRRRSGI